MSLEVTRGLWGFLLLPMQALVLASNVDPMMAKCVNAIYANRSYLVSFFFSFFDQCY